MLISKMLGAPRESRRKGWVFERRSVKNESEKERRNDGNPNGSPTGSKSFLILYLTTHDTDNSPIKIPHKAADASVSTAVGLSTPKVTDWWNNSPTRIRIRTLPDRFKTRNCFATKKSEDYRNIPTGLGEGFRMRAYIQLTHPACSPTLLKIRFSGISASIASTHLARKHPRPPREQFRQSHRNATIAPFDASVSFSLFRSWRACE